MTESLLYVDDRRSNTKFYKTINVGYQEESLVMQTTILDLVSGQVSNQTATLTFDIQCVTDIKMRDNLITIFCSENHEISILLVTEILDTSKDVAYRKSSLDLFAKEKLYDGLDSIKYEDVMLIRN